MFVKSLTCRTRSHSSSLFRGRRYFVNNVSDNGTTGGNRLYHPLAITRMKVCLRDLDTFASKEGDRGCRGEEEETKGRRLRGADRISVIAGIRLIQARCPPRDLRSQEGRSLALITVAISGRLDSRRYPAFSERVFFRNVFPSRASRGRDNGRVKLKRGIERASDNCRRSESSTYSESNSLDSSGFSLPILEASLSRGFSLFRFSPR